MHCTITKHNSKRSYIWTSCFFVLRYSTLVMLTPLLSDLERLWRSIVSKAWRQWRGGRPYKGTGRRRLSSEDSSGLCFKSISVMRIVEAGEWIDLLKAFSLWKLLHLLFWRCSLEPLSKDSLWKNHLRKIFYRIFPKYTLPRNLPFHLQGIFPL